MIYRLMEWLNFISTELHKQYSPLFNAAMPDAAKQLFKDKLLGRYKYVDERLEGKPFLMGEQFTVADAYLFTVTNWAKPVALDLSAYPRVLDFQKRVASRPSVEAALKVEGLKK